LKPVSTKASKDSSSSEEEDSSSDEDESEDEPVKTPKSKDVKMVDAAQAVTKFEKKEVLCIFLCEILSSKTISSISLTRNFVQPKTPANQSQATGTSTIFVGNLSYSIDVDQV
jgi:nucleolin